MNKNLSERQIEILNASLELIADNGIQSLTIKNLSKKIGIVESAIYRHYESKTQILIAILDSINANDELNVTSADDSIVSKLATRMNQHFSHFMEKPVLVSVVFSEDLFQNEPLLVEKTRYKIEKSIFDLAQLISMGQSKGEIRDSVDPEIASLMVNGSVRMLVKQWKMSNYSFDLVSKGNLLIETLISLMKNG